MSRDQTASKVVDKRALLDQGLFQLSTFIDQYANHTLSSYVLFDLPFVHPCTCSANVNEDGYKDM